MCVFFFLVLRFACCFPWFLVSLCVYAVVLPLLEAVLCCLLYATPPTGGHDIFFFSFSFSSSFFFSLPMLFFLLLSFSLFHIWQNIYVAPTWRFASSSWHLHSLLCLLQNNIVSLWRSFVATDLASLLGLKNRCRHWLCSMPTGRKNGLT